MFTKREFLTSLFLGAVSLMSTMWNFPRKFTLPIFTDEQDKALRRLFGRFKEQEVDNLVDDTLPYFKNDASNTTSYPNDITFTSSPGCTSTGVQESVTVTNSTYTDLSGYNYNLDVTNSTQSSVKDVGTVSGGTLTLLDKTDIDGRFNSTLVNDRISFRPATSSLENRGAKVLLLENPVTGADGISQKITVPIYGSLASIYESTGTEPQSDQWTTVAVVPITKTTAATNPYFQISGSYDLHVSVLNGGLSGFGIRTATEKKAFYGFLFYQTIDSISETIVHQAPATSSKLRFGTFPGTAGEALLATRVLISEDGNENLVLQVSLFIPSQASNGVVYTLETNGGYNTMCCLNGFLDAFVVQHNVDYSSSP